MIHAKSDSDITSLAPSSPPRSPRRPVYFVQSPSRESHDGDKSSMQATPVFNSPMESPTHPSFGRHSRNSSASRFSGALGSSSGRKTNRKRNDKGWPECKVIEEEGSYDDIEDRSLSRRCQVTIGILGFILLFTIFSLIIWGASRPYKAQVSVKSLSVSYFYLGEGPDYTGVPTKLASVNCSVKLSIYNPASLFGIHVSSSPVNLIHAEIPIATGQLKKYYQPRKSKRLQSVILQGDKVPLYGAGASLEVSDKGAMLPLTLEFTVRSRGNVIGKLVTVKHYKHVSCNLHVNSTSSKTLKIPQNLCTYD